jgi:hypothetical protein
LYLFDYNLPQSLDDAFENFVFSNV